MQSLEFRSREYGDGNSSEAIALVAGFDGKINHFDQTARALIAVGKDVVVYEYDNDLFLAGDPSMLPNLISDLTVDFQTRTANHIAHRFAGASIGGGIGWGMQRHSQMARPGIYAAVGADAAHVVMGNPVFRGMAIALHRVDPRKEFVRNGYSEADLRQKWQYLQVPPSTGFLAAMGGLDCIVRQKEVGPKFDSWRQEIDITVLMKKRLGHTGIIKWFSEHAVGMLESVPDRNTEL
jgi:hypothetical protein